MREPFGKFKRKHGTGSDREHVRLAAIDRYAGAAAEPTSADFSTRRNMSTGARAMPSSASYHIQDKVRVGLIRHVDGHLNSAVAAGVAIDS